MQVSLYSEEIDQLLRLKGSLKMQEKFPRGSLILFAAPFSYGTSQTEISSHSSQRNVILPEEVLQDSKDEDKSKGRGKNPWFKLLTFRKTVSAVQPTASKTEQPITIQDTMDMVAANCPVFYFHRDER